MAAYVGPTDYSARMPIDAQESILAFLSKRENRDICFVSKSWAEASLKWSRKQGMQPLILSQRIFLPFFDEKEIRSFSLVNKKWNLASDQKPVR